MVAPFRRFLRPRSYPAEIPWQQRPGRGKHPKRVLVWLVFGACGVTNLALVCAGRLARHARGPGSGSGWNIDLPQTDCCVLKRMQLSAVVGSAYVLGAPVVSEPCHGAYPSL